MAYRRNYRRNRGKNGRIKPKWFFDGSVGAGVPFIGGSKFRFGTKQMTAIAKRVTLKSHETKEIVRRITTPSLAHSTIYTTNLIAMTQGASNAQRVADSIYLCGINLKVEVQTTEADTFWRFFVIKSRQTWLSSSVNEASFGSGFGSTDLFRGGDVSPIGFLNTDNINIVSAKTLRVKPVQQGETTMTRELRMNVKLMQKYTMKDNTTGTNYNYYFVVVPWNNNPAATVGSTTVGSLKISNEVVYKED